MKAATVMSSFGRAGIEVWLWRHGFMWPIALLVWVAAALTQWVWVPVEQAAVVNARANLSQARQEESDWAARPRPVVVGHSDQQLVEAMRRIAYAQGDLTGILRQLSRLGQRHGVAIPRSEIQTFADGHAGFKRVQITLPLKVTYPAVRNFVEALLREFPGVSIEDVVMQRNTVEQGTPEVRLRLSVWIDPNRATPTADGLPLSNVNRADAVVHKP